MPTENYQIEIDFKISIRKSQINPERIPVYIPLGNWNRNIPQPDKFFSDTEKKTLDVLINDCLRMGIQSWTKMEVEHFTLCLIAKALMIIAGDNVKTSNVLNYFKNVIQIANCNN
jgi:hypothetical protein